VKGFGRAASAFVANAYPYSYAKGLPLRIAPEAAFELGLDMVALVRIRRRSLLGTAYNVLTGHPRGAMLYAHDADRIEIVCDRPMPLHVDGEDLGDVDAATFDAERGAVTVLA
jgi:diacylglycerol kinase family enzyme